MAPSFPLRRSLLVLAVLIVGALLGAASSAGAQQDGVEVGARLTHSEATVGERIGFEIRVRAPAGVAVTVPDLPLRVGDLDLIERLPDVVSPDGLERRYRYVLSPFQVGELFVPPVLVGYRTTNGQERFAATDAVALRVASVIPATDPAAGVRDLRPQADLEGEPFEFPWPFVAAGAGGLAGLLILYRIIRALMRRTWRRAPAPPVYLSPEDAARAALDELAASGTPNMRTLKSYYSLLSMVVRSYLTERYRFPALALTTTEMETRMPLGGLDRWQARLVSGLLTECDAVRYAQYVPAQQRARDDLDLAYEIIEVGQPRAMDEGLVDETSEGPPTEGSPEQEPGVSDEGGP